MTITFTGNASDFLKIGVAHAARGDIDAVREILKRRPKWIHQVGSHGRTMLWEACHRGKLPMVKYLVRRKANIDACGCHFTPHFVEISCYCIARWKRHAEVADFLLRKQAVVDIHSGAFLGDLDLVKNLLKRDRSLIDAGHPQHEMAKSGEPGPDFFLAPSAWATPLCYALRGGDPETVEYLIRRKAKIRGLESHLFQAANRDAKLVSMLLENGANPKFAPQADPDETALLDVVSQYGVKLPSIEHQSEELVYLCRGDRGGNPEEVKRLVSLGANVNHQDQKGKTAIHRAAKAGFIDTIKVLLKLKAKVNIADHLGETPIFDAVRSTIKNVERKLDSIQLLVTAKSSLRHKNAKGQTVLDVARLSKRSERQQMIRLLK